jgi:hypothetical protein
MGGVIALLVSVGATEGASVRTVALTGQPAPGAPVGAMFHSFADGPSLNNAGRTVFNAWMAGEGVSEQNDNGIWSDGAGQLELVAREGSRAPGTPEGFNFGFLSRSLPLSESGGTSFFADANGLFGLWASKAGELRLVARRLDRAPGTPGNIRFDYLGRHVGAERVAFYGGLRNTLDFNDSGIWSDVSGSLQLVALRGEQGPGAPPGDTFDYFDLTSIVLNDVGELVFRGRVYGNGISPYRDGIWRDNAGDLQSLALRGDQSPGLPDGITFAEFDFFPPYGPLGLNNAGQIAFSFKLAGTGIDSTNDLGVWAGEPGDFRLVAREGNEAPGAGGATFNYDLNGVVLNAKGQTAFQAFLIGNGVDSTNDSGIWSEGMGDLELVAREGSPAPGTPDGVVFRNFGFSEEALVLNAQGQVAFSAFVTGGGIDFGNDLGIWATDLDGQLQLIAREGDTFEIAPGDSRTIQYLGFVAGSGNEDGLPSGFNDLGQLAFMASFTDGSSGIFVSNLVAIPEPATLILASIALFTRRAFARRER